MLRSQVLENAWTLSLGGVPYIAHRPETPFAVALRREKTYESDRGTVKETVVEAERIPLAEVVQDGDTLTLCGGGHALTIRVLPCPGGVDLVFAGEAGWAYAFTLAALDGEAVFGGGEQYRQTNLRGEHVVNFVSEHIKATTILEKALLPRCLYKEKPHSAIGSYAPMPVFVTDKGRLFLFDTEADGVSRFLDDGYTFTFDSCPRKLTLLKGESYEALALLLADRIPNRQYIPDWCREGMILSIQGGTEAILTKTFAMLDAGARISGVWSQDWSGENRTIMGKQVWWNWEADEKLYPDLKGAIQKLNARGVRFLGYINPYLVKDSRLYNECREKKLLITKADGSIYHIKSTTFDAGMLDLTDPAAVRFVKDVLIKRNMLDLGMSGWMADFGEYLPVDAVLHDGDPKKLHNLWPVLWAKVNREAVEEYGAKDILFFMRSGYLGIQTYAPILWNGDQHTDTTHDYGMPCVMPASFAYVFRETEAERRAVRPLDGDVRLLPPHAEPRVHPPLGQQPVRRPGGDAPHGAAHQYPRGAAAIYRRLHRRRPAGRPRPAARLLRGHGLRREPRYVQLLPGAGPLRLSRHRAPREKAAGAPARRGLGPLLDRPALRRGPKLYGGRASRSTARVL